MIGSGYMMGTGGYMGGGFMIIFWIILLVALFFLFRGGTKSLQWKENIKKVEKTPLDILGERLARGEINIDEYNKKKQALSQSS